VIAHKFCEKVKQHLGKKTILELHSVQEIMKLLQEEGNLMYCGRESRGGVSCVTLSYLWKLKETKATGFEKLQAILNELKSVIEHVQLIPLSVNCYELLNNLKEPIMIKQNQDQENKNATDNRKERALARKSISYHH
jgi:hypothetical protein